MYLTFSFPHLPQFDQISSLDESSFLLILLNLNDLSWNLMSLVSFVKSVFSHNLMKILAFTSLSLSFFVLFGWSLYWLDVLLFFSHSLMLSQNLIYPWWISFLPSLMNWTFTFLWWTLFPKVDELFIGLIVFIEDLTKWCWIHKVNTSSSWDLSMHT